MTPLHYDQHEVIDLQAYRQAKATLEARKVTVRPPRGMEAIPTPPPIDPALLTIQWAALGLFAAVLAWGSVTVFL